MCSYFVCLAAATCLPWLPKAKRPEGEKYILSFHFPTCSPWFQTLKGKYILLDAQGALKEQPPCRETVLYWCHVPVTAWVCGLNH